MGSTMEQPGFFDLLNRLAVLFNYKVPGHHLPKGEAIIAIVNR